MFWNENKKCDTSTDNNVLPKYRNPDNELYGTYVVVRPNMSIDDLVAIQDWVKEHPNLTLVTMPVADILANAKRNGQAHVCIDTIGNVSSDMNPHKEFRELTLHLKPTVYWYNVEPAVIEVLGKKYDKTQLEEALRNIDSK
ncbi:hypothetical protein NVP2275O_317 [Vibrio phage 2.275.O._10N.286.54.E11]|nr:hypothetical protein NVP2275O_317 [Vibrio phage 2.275.O._10N.286.54.E11]